MNKLAKGSIAIGAGIALLLGGAGTLAYWNDSATLGAGTITAGELSVDSDGAAIWTVNGAAVTDPANFRIVPGDTLVLKQPLHVIAKGDNLKADLYVDYNSLVNVPQDAQGQELGIDILNAGSPSFTFDTSGMSSAQFTVANGSAYGVPAQTLKVTPGAAGIDETIIATVTFTFPWTSANDTMNAHLNLSEIGMIFQQKA